MTRKRETCSVPGCDNPMHYRDAELCSACYEARDIEAPRWRP